MIKQTVVHSIVEFLDFPSRTTYLPTKEIKMLFSESDSNNYGLFNKSDLLDKDKKRTFTVSY